MRGRDRRKGREREAVALVTDAFAVHLLGARIAIRIGGVRVRMCVWCVLMGEMIRRV